MKFLLLMLFTFLALCKICQAQMPKLPRMPLDPKDRITPLISSLSMRLDHFSITNLATFSMRYASNPQFYSNSGVVFIFVGGESPLEDALGYLYSGLMYEMAQTQGAYMYMTEHRYYGDSVPNASLTYLTVNQALADLASFIQAMFSNKASFKKVVLFGGSYPGSLATWARMKYPNLVNAAVAASGVYNIQVSNPLFNVVVQNSLNNYPGCVNVIKNGILATQAQLASPWGALAVKMNYGWYIYDDFTKPFNVQNFFQSIVVKLDDVVQYDRQEPNTNIAAMCANLTQQAALTNSYTSLYKYIRFLNSGYISASTMTLTDAKSWMYQVCTELGNVVTTDGPNQPYSNTVPLSYYQTICASTYGVSLSPSLSIANLGITYGGMKPSVTKVVFTVGPVDPWSSTEFTTNLNAQAPVLTIAGSSHCAVLASASAVNSPALTAARNTIKQLIPQWLI